MSLAEHPFFVLLTEYVSHWEKAGQVHINYGFAFLYKKSNAIKTFVIPGIKSIIYLPRFPH